jgi:hypothetical protein
VTPGLAGGLGEALDLRPVQPGRLGAGHDAADRAQPDPDAPGHRPVGQPQGPLLSQNLPDLPHGESLGRHRAPFVVRSGRRAGPPASLRRASAPDQGAAPMFTISDLRVHHADLCVHVTDPGVHVAPIRAFTFDRSRCSRWPGTRITEIDTPFHQCLNRHEALQAQHPSLLPIAVGEGTFLLVVGGTSYFGVLQTSTIGADS